MVNPLPKALSVNGLLSTRGSGNGKFCRRCLEMISSLYRVRVLLAYCTQCNKTVSSLVIGFESDSHQ